MRLGRKFRTRGLVLLSLAALCLIVAWSTMSGERTFSVVASTRGGELAFKGELNDWIFREVTICKIREKPDFRASPKDSAKRCADSIYEVHTYTDRIVEWRSETKIRFLVNGQGDLVLQTLTDATRDLPKGSLVIIPSHIWSGHGALTFQGTARLGGDIATGSRDYLIGGQWEARQSGFATSLFRNVTEVVKSGTLVRGSTVDIVGDGKEVLSYGHLTPGTSEYPGVEVALLTERGPLALRVSHYGLQQPAIFKPDWIDTISSSPMLVALAVLFSFIVAVIELLLAIPVSSKQR